MQMTRCYDADGCRAAVARAYRELRQCGVADRWAFEAATTVYRYHHPETEPGRLPSIVADCLAEADPARPARLS